MSIYDGSYTDKKVSPTPSHLQPCTCREEYGRNEVDPRCERCKSYK